MPARPDFGDHDVSPAGSDHLADPMSLGTAELARLSALLDHALDLPAADREAWLGRLEGEDARLGPTLRKLLAAPAAKETADLVIDRPPAFTTVVADAPGSDFAEGDAV